MEFGRPGPNYLLPRHSNSGKCCCISHLSRCLQNGRAGPSQDKDITVVVLEKVLGKSPAEDFSAGSRISQSADVRSSLPEAQVDDKSQVRLSLLAPYRGAL